MGKPEDVLAELDGDDFTMYDGLPNAYSTTKMRQMLKSVAAEQTYGKLRRGLKSVAARRRERLTARDASDAALTYAEANHALLVAIGIKLGVDVKAVLAPYVEDVTE